MPMDLNGVRMAGLDLDGIFVSDIPWSDYLVNYEEVLHRRDSFQPLPVLPSFDHHRSVIITGRPESEALRTRAWLDRWGFRNVRLFCRTIHYGGAIEDIAHFKAETAYKLGCTVFVESDPHQCRLIAAEAPMITVFDGAGRLYTPTVPSKTITTKAHPAHEREVSLGF